MLKVSCSLVLWLSWAGSAFVAPHTQGVAPSVRDDGLNTDLILQIVESTRVVPPGGMATLKYVLYSTGGVPGRIRLQVHAPPGWNVIDGERVQREWLLDAWDIVTQELRVAAPPDAPIGPNELIRLTATMVDVPGVSEALAHVQVLSGAGVRSGGAHLAMTTMVSMSRLDPSGSEQAHTGGNVDLSGQVGPRTNIALTYRQGPQESVSNYRYYQPEKYVSGSILHHAWNVQFGGRVISTGNVITGPSVTGDGIAVHRLKGRVLTEVVLAQPTTFSGEGAGHLWRGSLGLKTARGTIGVAVSDFSRPSGYSTLPPIADPTLDPDSLEDIERERALSSGRTSTRVQGVGLEANLQLARTHRLRLRGGTVRLESTEQDKIIAPAFEAQYSFSGRSATLNARLRETPPSVQGVYLPGDERSADGTLRLIDELRVVGRAYWYENVTLGQSYRAGTEGRSLGLRYTRRRWRVEANGNLRSAYSSTRSHRRTGVLSFGMPLEPISVNASIEIGEEEIPEGVYPYRSYRGDLRWSGEPGFVSFTVSSYASGGIRPRQRADLLTSLIYGGFELAGGAWITRGWTGGAPGVWTNVGLPVTPRLTLFLGLEHGPQPLAPNGSLWRFSLGIRRKLVVPLPFLRDSAVAQEHAPGPP